MEQSVGGGQLSAEPEQQASKEEVAQPATNFWPVIEGENVDDAQPTHTREREREYGAFPAPAANPVVAAASGAAFVKNDKQDPARTVSSPVAPFNYPTNFAFLSITGS